MWLTVFAISSASLIFIQAVLFAQGKTQTYPGCSQHQYGMAVDVQFSDNLWQEWYLSAARWLGLVTVSGDPVHVQTFPGKNFREVTEAMGLCSIPDPAQELWWLREQAKRPGSDLDWALWAIYGS